ncbi:MAG: response regulator [Bacillota bacterium]
MGVLIVDDTGFMRAKLAKMLRENYVEIAGEAVDGKDAVKKYMELQPSVVTMDITMPEMDGVQAIKEIMKLDPRAKIIVCSAMGQESIVMDAIKAGAKSYLIKPIKEERLVTEILNIMKL